MNLNEQKKRELLVQLLQENASKTLLNTPENQEIENHIAIVGLSGRYPMSDSIDKYWENLCEGKNCISDVPQDRWNWKNFISSSDDQNDLSRRKGGFINNVDKFDPLFFGLSPREAERMDPQERLFLQTAWHTLEDAGYTPEHINQQNGTVGIFVGVMNSNYSILGSSSWKENLNNDRVYACNPTFWSIANRVSYCFNFNGPSLAIDSACSSSLTAIHLACESIKREECDAAIAGGVNLILHPAQLDGLSKMNMLSRQGNCHSFGSKSDGFTDGEGIGALLLKPLKSALADGDHIYATIRASSINSCGKTGGFTVPNPNAQAELIATVIKKSNIDVHDISYIEAHGTGTSLGDPIEVRGLTKAFNQFTNEKQFCALGSVKSNIGHLESAAGISGLTKILLQMKHNMLVPSINADQENEHINFKQTPFYLQKSISPWNENSVKIAGISSFGAGGSNAHLIVKSYETTDAMLPAHTQPCLIPLSATHRDQLTQYAKNLLDFIDQHSDTNKATKINLLDVAYTLSVGRISLPTRIALVVSDLEELKSKLTRFLQGEIHTEGLFEGTVPKNKQPKEVYFNSNNRDILETLANEWVTGEIDKLSALFEGMHAKRTSLPCYPFLKERYWINTASVHKQKGTEPLQPPTTPIIAPTADMDLPGTLYLTPCWKHMPINPSTTLNKANSILIFSNRTDRYDVITEAFTRDNQNIKTQFVKMGECFYFTNNNEYTVSPDKKEDIVTLLTTLQNNNTELDTIIYAWPDHENEANDFLNTLDHSIQPLLYICQILAEQKIDQKTNLLVWSVDNGNKNDLIGTAYAGFVKSLKAERQSTQVKHVFFSGSEQHPLTFQLKALINELSESKITHIVTKYIEKQRMVEQIRSLQLLIENQASPIIKKNGTYLITGGAGGLGKIFAQHFADIGSVNLILTGRSALDDEKQSLLSLLSKNDNEVVYYTCDVTSEKSMKVLFEKVTSRFNTLNGIIHSAGIVKDCLLNKKEWPYFKSVIDTKIKGINYLDAESTAMPLDFFISFSSVSSVLGNIGQCDYAYGNSYLDSFSFWRNNLVNRGERSGHSISINWPIWKEGGMHIDLRTLKGIEERIGVIPLSTEDGVTSFDNIATVAATQAIPIYGIRSRIINFLKSINMADSSIEDPKYSGKTPQPSPVDESAIELLSQTLDKKLRELVSATLDIAEERIDSDEVLNDFGFDSITLKEFSESLKREFNVDISPAIFFSQNTINKIKTYLISEYPQKLVYSLIAQPPAQHLDATNFKPQQTTSNMHAAQTHSTDRDSKQRFLQKEDIAIIGMNGTFPGAKDLETFWSNLITGIDSITEIPAQRWRWQDYYGNTFGQTNKMNSKWGGFIPDVDKFDYEFFGISENEAVFMDPQQRLFLQTVWKTIEHSGYQVSSLKNETMGVFVGVEFSDYKDLVDQYSNYKAEMAIGNAHNMIPNRVSFYFDFDGPSEAIDTACSSSLIAVNRAVRSIQSGESSMAIAGGVSLTLSPKTMIGTSQLNIYSPSGRCKTLDKNADGYVKGEGVAAILLKPLSCAIEDGDNILGIVKGCSVNHGGRSNSITAPNPDAQARLLKQAYSEANIEPERISYLEMHGTGTNLGDPVEVEGMKSAFQQLAEFYAKPIQKRNYCGIGSVKTNIGHLEPAAGIAGLIKVLLAMREEQLPANLHFKELNPLIKIEDSPFYVVEKAQQWERQTYANGHFLPFVAGISSFGFGGSNAHVVIEEYIDKNKSVSTTGEFILTLSAKSLPQLRNYAAAMLDFAKQTMDKDISLADTIYTLQIGRQAMDERIALVIHNWQEYVDSLQTYLSGESADNTYQGNIHSNKIMMRELLDADLQQHFIKKQNAHLLAKWWVLGLDIDWALLYQGQQKRYRLPLPSYPFVKTQCWTPLKDNVIELTQNSSIENQTPIEIENKSHEINIENHSASNNEDISYFIHKAISKITGKKREEIQNKDHLASDLNLDSIKMMGLVNELISSRPNEQIQYFNNLGMNTIIAQAQTVSGLIEIFEKASTVKLDGVEPTKDTHQADSSVKSLVESSNAELLDAQLLFLPAYFLTKSSSLCSYVEINGPFNLDRAKQIWKDLITRHPALRIKFNWPNKSAATFADVTAEFIGDCTPPELSIWDINNLSPTEKGKAISETFEEKLNHNWDLAKWPLHEFSIIKKSDECFVLFWSNEHIISDGLSNQQALKEFLELYQASISGVELPTSTINTEEMYRNLVHEINSYTSSQEDSDYRQFNQVQADNYCFNPEGKERDIAKAHFVNTTKHLSVDETQALIDLTKTSRFSLNTLLTGALLQALSTCDKYEQRFILQVPTSGRIYPNIHIAETIGCFAQNLSLTFSRFNENDSIEDFLEIVQNTIDKGLILGIDRAQTRQLSSMVRQMPLSEDNTLPQHSINMLLENIKSNFYFPYTGHTNINPQYGDLKITQYSAGTSNSPGAIDMLQEIFNGSLHIFSNYDANYFSNDFIDEFSNNYITALINISQIGLSVKESITSTVDIDNQYSHLVKVAEEVCQINISPEDMTKDLEAELGFDSLDRIRLVTHLQSSETGSINRAKLVKCRSLYEMANVLASNTIESASETKLSYVRHAIATDENHTIPAILTQQDLPIFEIIDQCHRTPDAIAVTHYDGTSITYRELNEQSNQIAHLLKGSGIGRNDYVGLLCNRGPLMLTGILAILKSGAAYVPIDPVFPAARVSYILNHAKIKTLLTEPDLTSIIENDHGSENSENAANSYLKNLILLKETKNSQVIQLAKRQGWEITPVSNWQGESNIELNLEVLPTDDMVVLFTSGSTGNPKGVTLNHIGYSNRLKWHQKIFQLQPGEKVAQKTSCCFDVSVWELLWPLMYGGIVSAVEKQTVSNPWEFADWIEKEGINIVHFVPSMFGEFTNTISAENRNFATLRWLIFSGEALPTATVQKWIDQYGLETRLCNLYGPTEASIDVSYHFINERPEDDVSIPIGKAVDNTFLLILDKEGNPAPKGALGELCIGGVQLAKGYLYEPELTDKVFIPNNIADIPGEKLYKTGDLAIERDGGSFDYHGRIDSQVKLRGFRVELGEIENVACCHNKINEAAALIVNRGGNDKLALWYAGEEIKQAELKAFINSRCPDYMVPHLIFNIDILPKNPNGKLDRKALLKIFNNALEPTIKTHKTAESEKHKTLPVGPAQKWIFSYFDLPFNWWGYNRLLYRKSFNSEVFGKTINSVIHRHDALRTTFAKIDGKWMQTISPNVPTLQPDIYDFSNQTAVDKENNINQLIFELANKLDYTQWPLCQFAIVKTANDCHEVIWIAHHLISDLLSGHILLKEIWKIYANIQNGTNDLAAIHTPSRSYADYIEDIQQNQTGEELSRSVTYWKKYTIKNRSRIEIPFDHQQGENIESSSQNFIIPLDQDVTNLMQRDARDHFEASFYQLLVAPLYKVISTSLRRTWIVLSHKTNGRNPNISGSNYFESIGNFAINVPVGISIRKHDSFEDIVTAIKQEFSNLPLGGASYDWVSDLLPTRAYPDNKLTSIRVNYLGDITPLPNKEFEGDPEKMNQRLALPAQKRTCLLEFFFYTKNKTTFLDISYSDNFYSKETIERLASNYVKQIQNLVNEVESKIFITS